MKTSHFTQKKVLSLILMRISIRKTIIQTWIKTIWNLTLNKNCRTSFYAMKNLCFKIQAPYQMPSLLVKLLPYSIRASHITKKKKSSQLLSLKIAKWFLAQKKSEMASINKWRKKLQRNKMLLNFSSLLLQKLDRWSLVTSTSAKFATRYLKQANRLVVTWAELTLVNPLFTKRK